MLDGKKWMYIPLNLKVKFENLTVAYEKLNVESENLNVAWINVACKKVESRVQTQMTNSKCRIDCAKYNVKWNIEFGRKRTWRKVKATGLSSEPARWSCDNCQRMSDFNSCQSNHTHTDGLHNWQVSVKLCKIYCDICHRLTWSVCTGGRAYTTS